MFLSKDFLDGDGPPAGGPTPSASSTGRPQADDSGRPLLGARPPSAGGRPGSAYGRPGTGASEQSEDAEGVEAATPTSAANLRMKMMQQRQKQLSKQQQRATTAVSGSTGMVQANQSVPTDAGSPTGSKTGGTPSMGRSGTLTFNRPSSAASTRPPTSGADISDATSLASGVGGGGGSNDFSRPMGASSASMQRTDFDRASSTMSMDENEESGPCIMPEPSVDKDEEARRRATLQQELDARGISPVYDPTPSGGPGGGTFDVRSVEAADMKAFLMNPSPKNVGMIECHITRERSGLNKLFPKYTVESESGVFLMSAKKQKQSKTSNYLITMSRGEVGKDADTFLGKLRSNFLGLEFTAYGAGLNPKKIDPTMSPVHAAQLARQELVAAQYSSSLWGSKPSGPRKMSAVIPRVQPNGERIVCRTLNPDTEGLLALTKQGGCQHLVDSYTNKPPKWNDQIGAFVLNFNKRVTQASVKNFQLISAEDPDTVFLQFGRVGKDVFNMDFRYPISPFQAFAICLSSFDYKLCCE